jgi:hypothetical protein
MAQRANEPDEPQGADIGIDDLGEGAALVSAGMTLMRIENETMQAVSVQRRRDEDVVLNGALAELERYPDLAARKYYSIPFKESAGSDRTFQVEGPSVHAALDLARRWGNCSVYAVLMSQDDEHIHLSGVFIDLESNFRIAKPFTVSKLLKRRGGRTEVLRDQRLQMAVQAGSSKAVRNAVISGLPDGLVESYYQRAKAVAGREAKQRWAKMLEAFRQFGVSRDMIENHLGHPLEKITDAEVADLGGIFNSLRDGIATATDVFTRKTGEPEGDQGATSTVDDVVGKGADVTAGTQAPRNGESPPERSASTQKSVDPEAPETGAEPEAAVETIGVDGALLLAQTAKVRATEIGAEVEEILAAVADTFGVEETSQIQKTMLAAAIKLIATAQFEPEEKPTAEPETKPDAPADPQPEQRDLDAGKDKVGF